MIFCRERLFITIYYILIILRVKMAKQKILNLSEKTKIDVYRSEGYSNRAIAKKIGRSPTVVDNYIKDPEGYGKNFKGRVSLSLSTYEKRKIIRIASNSALSLSKIRAQAGVEASKSSVRRVIKSCEYLKYLKLQKKPPLNAPRKEKRLQFARDYMVWDVQQRGHVNDWRTVVFTDEKKFNLDGPDGYNYYFHDLRKEKRFLNRHHSREGGVMVWGAITYYGTIDLEFQSAKMTGASYKTLLESAFPKFSELFGPISWILQQDNAPIHNARVVKEFIASQNVNILDWPPYSPDLNIIENVWGWLSRKVYEGGRQFDDKQSLIEAIKDAWNQISLDYINSLYLSMKTRIFEVIKNKGGCTHY